MNRVFLDKKDVPPEWLHLFGYNGTKYRVEIHESGEMTITDNDIRMSGGSWKSFLVLVDGKKMPVSECKQWPDVGSQHIKLNGIIVAEHCYFCGKDMGLVFHVDPNSVNPLRIEQPTELTELQQAVLWVHVTRKSSYNGKNRHDMLNESRRWKHERPVTQAEWISTVEELKEFGMIDKRNAATNKGRNAVQSFRNMYM